MVKKIEVIRKLRITKTEDYWVGYCSCGCAVKQDLSGKENCPACNPEAFLTEEEKHPFTKSDD